MAWVHSDEIGYSTVEYFVRIELRMALIHNDRLDVVDVQVGRNLLGMTKGPTMISISTATDTCSDR